MSQRQRPSLVLGICLIFCAVCSTGLAQPISVEYVDGHLTLQCSNAGLAQVFQQIESKTGVELILEDEVKSKRITADLVHQPLQLAIQRLLDGLGVNYAVLMDPADWQRVNKVFVGAGGGGNGRPLPPRGRAAPTAVPQVDDGYGDEEADDFDEMDDFDDDEFGDEEDPANLPQLPPGVDPNAAAQGGGFNYFGQNNFTRSNVTPGLPSAPPFAAPPTPTNPAAPQNQNPGAQPAPTFADPFGQPIPVPPNQQQQPNNRRNQNR